LLNAERYQVREIVGDRLWIVKNQARLIDGLQRIADDSQNGGLLFFAPDLPAMYWIIGQRSPVWDPYPIWPASTSAQMEMVSNMSRSGVNRAIIGTHLYAESYFRDNFPIVQDFLQRDFEARSEPPIMEPYILYERRIHTAADQER
jgi:hypothetical protein